MFKELKVSLMMLLVSIGIFRVSNIEMLYSQVFNFVESIIKALFAT